MDFATLQVFRAVAEEGGISAAARKLHRVQSNVTARIQQLEASLGAPLFVRERRRLHLSPAGETFLGYARQILQAAEEARAALQGREARGVLRVGTLESTAASRLPALLSRYHEKYPDVRVELSTGTTDALVEAVAARELEAAFVANFAPAPTLLSLPAFAERLVLILPRAHPPVRRAHDVRADTIISFPAGCAYRRLLQGWLAESGLTPPRVLELGSYHAIAACVASGTGVGIVPRSVLATLKDTRGLRVAPLGGRFCRATTSLIWRRREDSPALQALRAMLKPSPARQRDS
jgi:DNA-binding transcriptional LysR family regulator